jgi:hypothetical protein
VVEYAAEHPYTVVEHRSNYSQVRVSSDVQKRLRNNAPSCLTLILVF